MADDFNVGQQASGIVDDNDVIGDVGAAKETAVLVPPTKRVKFFIKDSKNFSLDKSNSPRDWKFLSLEMYLDLGIEIAGKIQFKNKAMWQNIPYFANSAKYDFVNNQYFVNRSYLVPLNQLAKAFGLDVNNLTPKLVQDTIRGQFVYADIVQQAETTKVPDPATGVLKRVKTGDFINEIKNFVKIDPNQLS